MVVEVVKSVGLTSDETKGPDGEYLEKDVRNSTTESSKPTELTNVNTDCIEHMLKKLSLNELLNIADSCKFLREEAETEFSRKYGKRSVWLDFMPDSSAPTVIVRKNSTKISDLKTCLQILRCFGHLIKNLHITVAQKVPYGREIEHAIWLIDYVTRYCRNFVSEITFEKFTGVTLHHLTKPFVAAKKVRFEYCVVEETLAKFGQLFPNAGVLELFWTDVAGIGKNIRNLHRLEVNMPMYLNKFQMDNIEAVIKLNPQLGGLKLFFGCDVEFMQAISDCLNSIEDLEIGCLFSNSEMDDNVIHFKDVTRMKLLHQNVPVAFTIDKCEEFTLERTCLWTDENIHSIGKHSNITKLVINPSHLKFRAAVSEGIALKMANALPLVREIDFRFKQFSVDEAMYFLHGFKSLRKVSFRLADRVEFAALTQRMDKKWTAVINDENRVELEQRI